MPNYREMPYGEYLLTEYWQSKRNAAIERARFCCQLCCSEYGLHVHHRTYARLGCELDGDLTVLCAKCHQLFHDHAELADGGLALIDDETKSFRDACRNLALALLESDIQHTDWENDFLHWLATRPPIWLSDRQLTVFCRLIDELWPGRLDKPEDIEPSITALQGPKLAQTASVSAPMRD
jgi:hypothetical protein